MLPPPALHSSVERETVDVGELSDREEVFDSNCVAVDPVFKSEVLDCQH